MLPNLILIGFMGSGKSSIGRRLATATGHRFLDTDDLVVEQTGCSISDIFAAHGEAHFRDLESAALQELSGVCGIVLATGGGIVLRPENRDALHTLGIVTWLDADPDLIFERVSRNQKRPLLQTENPRHTFDTLLASRQPVYREAADLQVDTTHLSHEEAARQILDASLRFHARQV